MNKIIALIVVAALTAAFIARPSGAAVDSWSGRKETVIPFSQAITAGTVATVITAVSGVAQNIRALTITNSASGTVRLYSGTTNGGSNLIGAWGVIANTPLTLSEEQCGQGVIGRLSEAIIVDASTGTVTMTMRVRADPTSPKQ